MSKKPLTRAELKRLEQLQKQLELKESKLNNQESKLKKQKKDLESDTRKLATEKKQFANEKKQFKQEKEISGKNSAKLKTTKQDRPFSAQKSRKLKEDYAALKKKHEHFAKLMRDYKKKADQLDAENAVLRRRVQNAANKKLPTNDKQLRSLMKENRWLKKKLREMMKELAKQKRWYSRVVKVFKDNNNKWVQKRIEAYKDKQYIIKYVFLDDIKRVVLTRNGHDRNGFKPRLRVRNGRGGSVLVRNVGIKVRDTKVRKRNRKGKRDRKVIKGDKGKNNKDVITKTRPGKDGKNVIKTKYVDKGGKDTVTKQRPGKDGKNKGGKKGKKGGKGGKDGKGSGSGDSDDDDNDNNNDDGDDDDESKKKKRKKKRSSSKADAVTSEFLKSGAADGDDDAKTPTSGDGDNGDGDDGSDGDDDDDDVDPNASDYDPDDWEDVEDPEDKLDDYMMEFLAELGVKVNKDELGSFENKLDDAGGSGAGSDDDDDAAADAALDKEFETALKTDKDLMFDGDNAGGGSAEFQAQIMYLINEMDSRNADLNNLKDIVSGVQYSSKADSGGNEEELEEKELKTPKEKLDAMALIFTAMQERQEALLTSLEGVNCDTDALRPINEHWYDQYHALAQLAITSGGGEAAKKAEENFEKLRYFVDYFMKELVGRMYDLRCVNAAHYNQAINFTESGQPKDEDNKTDEDDDSEDKPVFDSLQGGMDDRHSGIQDVVSKDEVMNADNSEDKAAAAMQSCLQDFLSNIDDWKSLIQETRTKHETWIDKRTTLMNALEVRHAEIGELMSKVKSVPSYSMNLQKYVKEDDNDETDNDNDDTDADNYAAPSGDESGAE